MTKTTALALEEKQLLEKWRKNTQGVGKKTNYIVLDNNATTMDENKKPVANPNFGKLFAVSYNEAGEEVKEEMKAGDSFFPAHVRMHAVCRNYDDTPTGKKARYWCEEVEQGEDIILKDKDNNIVYQGAYKDAKEKYELKYKSVVYAWYADKIYRWKIGGGETLSSWFAVNKAISKANYPHLVKIASITPNSNGTIHWNDVEFVIGEKFDLKQALNLNDAVRKTLNEYYEGKKEEPKAKETTLDDLEDLPDFLES